MTPDAWAGLLGGHRSCPAVGQGTVTVKVRDAPVVSECGAEAAIDLARPSAV